MCSTTEEDFILEWADRWCHLRELIFNYLRTDDTSRSPGQPGELDHISYQYLRAWFLDNENMFLQIWKAYYMKRDWVLDSSNNLVEEIRGAEKDLENPFFCFYESEDLNVLFRACVLNKQSGQPSEERACTTAMGLITLDAMAAAFVMEVRDGTADAH
tara:strand:+ start:115 stop:588 length:474 start_codon:yes stop_codon:yes gene_type:complete